MIENAERHLERVINRTIRVAELAGQDHTAQNKVATRTLRWMRPDMTVSEALAKVRLVRQEFFHLARRVDRPK